LGERDARSSISLAAVAHCSCLRIHVHANPATLPAATYLRLGGIDEITRRLFSFAVSDAIIGPVSSLGLEDVHSDNEPVNIIDSGDQRARICCLARRKQVVDEFEAAGELFGFICEDPGQTLSE